MATTGADRAVWRRRAANAAILAVVVFAALGLAWASGLFGKAGQPTVTIGAPFSLTAQDGKPLSSDDLEGTPFAVFFGFTNCPEVCPTTLWEMSETLKALGPDADRLKVLFVSVDPVRDKPEFMARYLQSFDSRIVGLSGSEEEIAALAKAYRVYYRKVPLEGGDYTMDHTTSVFLMDARGEFTGTIAYEEEAASRLAKLKRLISGA